MFEVPISQCERDAMSSAHLVTVVLYLVGQHLFTFECRHKTKIFLLCSKNERKKIPKLGWSLKEFHEKDHEKLVPMKHGCEQGESPISTTNMHPMTEYLLSCPNMQLQKVQSSFTSLIFSSKIYTFLQCHSFLSWAQFTVVWSFTCVCIISFWWKRQIMHTNFTMILWTCNRVDQKLHKTNFQLICHTLLSWPVGHSYICSFEACQHVIFCVKDVAIFGKGHWG